MPTSFSDRVFVFITGGFLLLFLGYSFLGYDYRIKKISKDLAITSGCITKNYTAYKRGGFHVDYTIVVNGKLYKSTGANTHAICKLVDKYFPVAYEQANPQNSKILLCPEDFELFNLSLPDSLSWVLPYTWD